MPVDLYKANIQYISGDIPIRVFLSIFAAVKKIDTIDGIVS
jgi:hypothetical protein